MLNGTSSLPPREAAEPDLEAAAMYLDIAREAQQAGDHVRCQSALRMIGIALQLTEALSGKFHLSHLKEK